MSDASTSPQPIDEAAAMAPRRRWASPHVIVSAPVARETRTDGFAGTDHFTTGFPATGNPS
ncbi:MAG: hypothetical protein Q8M24_02375 [Pseudolabrys sp.]|nr:hypothetical protein [Pseudolabrys sp.]MDP2294291.1 hypothetical protein [Pseudolabrys sp.]